MRTPVKLGGFVLGLGASFGVAFGVGRFTGHPDRPSHPAGHTQVAGRAREVPWPVGMTTSRAGYTLQPHDAHLHDHDDRVFAFTIAGPDGMVVRRFTPVEGTAMDLVVVSRDLSGYRHARPDQQVD